MEHSRVNLSKYFLSMAEEDLEIAKVLLKTEHYAGSVFHSQQCIEKSIKSVLILFGVFIKTHYVSNLLVRNLDKFDEYWKERFDSLLPIIRELERHWALPRYPEPMGEEVWNPLDNYTKEDAEECIKNAEEVLKVVNGFLKEKYGLG
ncbi:HEPN domain-containing protein [Methanotorris formicicus]|uniref:HEPN domain protein n=1 Tax=Methanotorris formicicus Mc-S-70 TaxID=647171 RepID=H1KX83_9EURY|nr:HEPN domain-containing protein [Methanotorris formicicus]EHP88514.1 HEPN domain protein [Methanotorris formicicus Mc-S-70]